MRKTALLWLLLAAVCGAILFQTSQRVNDGRQKLAEIGVNTKKQEESLRVLQAEWSYLNQPDRLEKLSQKYLGLVPLQGKQFAKTSDIPARPPQAEKTEAEKTETTVPQVAVVEEKPAAPPAAPIVKIQQKPVTPPTVAQKPAAPVRNPSATAQRDARVNVWREAPRTAPYQQPSYQPPAYQPRRGFNDVMKSLGVE